MGHPVSAVLVMYTVARVISSYEGDELCAVCSDRTIAERAVAEVWNQDPLASIQITEWLVDVFGPAARRGVFRGDRTDYVDPSDPEDGPRWHA